MTINDNFSHVVFCQYVPIKNVFVRLKEEVIVSKKEKTEKKRETRSRRRRERPQTIQSHSIFEQGPADSVRKIGIQKFSQMYLISLETVDSSLILSVCTGWRGIPHVQDSSIIPVVNLVKKERKETREDQDEIISKLQKDDVTIYY